MPTQRTVTYVTSSTFKIEENKIFWAKCQLSDGTRVCDQFCFEYRKVEIPERLEVDIEKMVRDEVREAYAKLRIPCIVEHAGLIFDDYDTLSYPGGLTKPMWNTLGPEFIKETNSAGRGAIARAVVAYCDGKRIRTFTGETTGRISAVPKGDRKFYWDTVFIPNDPTGKCKDKTYAEIVADTHLGLEFKVQELSQSTKAMKKFLDSLRSSGGVGLWS